MENRCPPESVNSLLTPCAFRRLATSRPPWKVCVSCSAPRVADIDGDSTCSAPARAVEWHTAAPLEARRPMAAADAGRSRAMRCRTRLAQQAMPGARFELAWPLGPRILSPLRMPIPPPGPALASLRRHQVSQCEPVRSCKSETSRLLRCQGGVRLLNEDWTACGGLRIYTRKRPARPAGPFCSAASAVRRTPDRAHAARQPRRLRDPLLALSLAAAVLLPTHARLARGRRGCPAGGLRRRLQRRARRRARDQRAAVAVPHRAQPLAEPPAPRHRSRRRLDGRALRRSRPLYERSRDPPRELPRAALRRPQAARDAAHRAAAARDRRALLRADRAGDGHNRPFGQVVARAGAHLARRGRRGAQAQLRGSAPRV